MHGGLVTQKQVPRAARAERPRLQQPVQRHVFRREDRRDRSSSTTVSGRRPGGAALAEADPQQWDQIPEVVKRTVEQTDSIEVRLSPR